MIHLLRYGHGPGTNNGPSKKTVAQEKQFSETRAPGTNGDAVDGFDSELCGSSRLLLLRRLLFRQTDNNEEQTTRPIHSSKLLFQSELETEYAAGSVDETVDRIGHDSQEEFDGGRRCTIGDQISSGYHC